MILRNAALACLLPLAFTRAATFYCDPAAGTAAGDGSAAKPWRTIQEVVESGAVSFCRPNDGLANSNAVVRPGDAILLRSGWHGVLRIPTGFNPEPITIAAAPGQRPSVGWVEISAGCNWVIKGLTISPSLAPSPLTRVPPHLASLGERGGDATTNLVIEDCFLYSVSNTKDWSARDWVEKTPSGIWLGRGGSRHVARNNHVLNTRFGINLCAAASLCEGNVVENFSADGIRVTRDGQVVQYNVIKNNFVSARDGDANHDDGIQIFLFNVGTGPVRDVTLRGNIIVARENDGLPFPNGLQGIGGFDGPLIRFVVEENVIAVNHYHGLSLYDAQSCIVQSNTCFSRWSERARPWIMLGQKKNQAHGNTVQNNLAYSYSFKADAAVTTNSNGIITDAEFRRREAALLGCIESKFGVRHPASGEPRLRRAEDQR